MTMDGRVDVCLWRMNVRYSSKIENSCAASCKDEPRGATVTPYVMYEHTWQWNLDEVVSARQGGAQGEIHP